MIKTISFPGGSGGNWLKAVIEKETITNNSVHFHSHYEKPLVDIKHTTDPTEFDYLLSGSYYFNFFVNVMYKCFYIDRRFTETTEYKDYYTECINTSRYLCKFASLSERIFFNFDDLLDNDRIFFNQISNAFPESDLTYLEFLEYKDSFFKTMVRTDSHYENFDSQIWVTFVLGQLMNLNIVPVDFSIYDRCNQKLASQFARDNYHCCCLTRVHHFDSEVAFPDIL